MTASPPPDSAFEPVDTDPPRTALAERGDGPGGVLIIRLAKQLSISAAPDLRRALHRLSGLEPADGNGDAATPARQVVLDLGQTESLDSGALGVLIQFRKDLANASPSGQLMLARPTDAVRGVLQIMKLETVLPHHPDIESAAAAFREDA